MTDYEHPARDLDDTGSALTLESNGDVAITAFKKAYGRDTLIVRLLNTGKTEATGTLKVGTTVKIPDNVYEVTLGEERIRPLPLSNGAVAFTLRPAGLLTLEFEMAQR
jgi:alpha-mannosidase